MSPHHDHRPGSRLEGSHHGRGLFGSGHGAGGAHVRALGNPVEKAKDFFGTLRRLAVYLEPFRWKMTFLFGMTIFSTILNTLGASFYLEWP